MQLKLWDRIYEMRKGEWIPFEVTKETVKEALGSHTELIKDLEKGVYIGIEKRIFFKENE